MNRSSFVNAWVSLASLVFVLGCGTEQSSPPRDPAPLVLAELRAASPGPWRHEGREPIAVTALDRPSGAFPPAGRQGTAGAGDSQPRWTPSFLGSPHDEPAGLPPAGARPPESTPLDASPPSQARPPSQQGAAREIGEPRRLVELSSARQSAPRLAPAIARTAGLRGTLSSGSARQQVAHPDLVLKAAGDRVRSGFRLARRNALYLAQAEFVAALELVAEAHDMRSNTRFHSDALNAGLVALAESGDFVRQAPAGQRGLDVAQIVSSHDTPILKHPPLNHLAPRLAAGRYCAFAQDQLSAAAARHADASMALFGLGQTAQALGAVSPTRRLQSEAEATALYQAALLVDAANFGAAAELGAILAHQGELVRARDLLVHSVRLAPHPATHRSLAAVYARLGEAKLAARSASQAKALEHRAATVGTDIRSRR